MSTTRKGPSSLIWEVRQALDDAWGKKKVETSAIGTHVYDYILSKGLLTDATVKHAVTQYLLSLVPALGRLGAKKERDPVLRQINLFEDFDTPEQLNWPGKANETIRLGSFIPAHVNQKTMQMRKNLEDCRQAYETWTAAQAVVLPVMTARGCSWEEAVEHLRESGRLPEIY